MDEVPMSRSAVETVLFGRPLTFLERLQASDVEWDQRVAKDLSDAFARVAALERALKIANLKANQLHEFCPDHRDKQRGKPCLACTVETLERRLKHALEVSGR